MMRHEERNIREMQKRLRRVEEALSNLEIIVWGIRSGGLLSSPWIQPGEVISTSETVSATTGPSLAPETPECGHQLAFSFDQQPSAVQPG